MVDDAERNFGSRHKFLFELPKHCLNI